MALRVDQEEVFVGGRSISGNRKERGKFPASKVRHDGPETIGTFRMLACFVLQKEIVIVDFHAPDIIAQPGRLGWETAYAKLANMGAEFKLVSNFKPCGDQPQAIEALLQGLEEGKKDQVLLGVTGSGKTFTVANLIARSGLPALVLAPNKTLAGQLYTEFKGLFPENAVEYFVSYYDYYQPEAYIPSSDTYIEKDASRNEKIDQMRHSATRSLLSREDVIIVASVSCIYGLGSPEAYGDMTIDLKVGEEIDRDVLLRKLASNQYARNNLDLVRGCFRVRGDVVEIFPSHEEDRIIRVEFFGDQIDSLVIADPLRGEILAEEDRVSVFPASHYVTPQKRMALAIKGIEEEKVARLLELRKFGKALEAQRLEQRTNYDLELMREIGFCNGIENYSRHLDGRKAGEPPATLINYFPRDFLLIADESHVSVPQVGAMYKGDRARKTSLVEHGFRLPSALDNRPLTFDEYLSLLHRVIHVSATPGKYELEKSGGKSAEQIIRPTGLCDPEIEVRPARGQVDDLLGEIRIRVKKKERVLVTTLTKRMAEELTDYYQDLGIKVKYLHSDIDTLDRSRIIRDLRLGKFDVLVGINLLREGLDIPEVSLVAILDADKEGFLRSERSLIQTCGRAARNLHGSVLMYGDKTTDSMAAAIGETNRRREIQARHNKENNIRPRSIQKSIAELPATIFDADYSTVDVDEKTTTGLSRKEMLAKIQELRKGMSEAADQLEYERAAELRDEMRALEAESLEVGGSIRKQGRGKSTGAPGR